MEEGGDAGLKGGHAMKSWRIWALTLARIFCGFVFVYASLDKLGEAQVFAKLVTAYHILPSVLVPLAAVVIPWLEFFTGLSLIAGYRWRGASLVYCGMMTGYTFGLAINMLRGVSMTCGCFSMMNAEPVTWWTVGRDLVLLIPGLFVLFSEATRLALSNLPCCSCGQSRPD
jgi:uncharacterized membrane protein YphA (DoxX/SURF4 family)